MFVGGVEDLDEHVLLLLTNLLQLGHFALWPFLLDRLIDLLLGLGHGGSQLDKELAETLHGTSDQGVGTNSRWIDVHDAEHIPCRSLYWVYWTGLGSYGFLAFFFLLFSRLPLRLGLGSFVGF
ncbi:hypothetical protein VDGD_21432 [Verticillium dahliae]|nr:hypothetical protein VDGD_21432 [Verticillium dahliae]